MKHENSHNTSGSSHKGRGHRHGRYSGDMSAGDGHRHHHGGTGRMGRLFEHGDLRLVALQLIAEKPRHGYEIIKAIEEQSSGVYTPSAGAVYPTLTLLQELGQLTVKDGEDARKQYAITEEGKAALFANRKTVEGVFARILKPVPAADLLYKLRNRCIGLGTRFDFACLVARSRKRRCKSLSVQSTI